MDVKTILDWLGYPATIIAVVLFVNAVVLWILGITPALLRLGNGLVKRKIAVFAKADDLRSLENLLKDCKLFSCDNMFAITGTHDLKSAENASVLLLNWSDWGDHIDDVLALKHDRVPLVVYAAPRSIPDDAMAKLSNERNVAVCNFRGRLLNDLVTSMITTSY